MISTLGKDLIASNQEILRLKVTEILRIWLKKFCEPQPRSCIKNIWDLYYYAILQTFFQKNLYYDKKNSNSD
jgi:hypothetical protein